MSNTYKDYEAVVHEQLLQTIDSWKTSAANLDKQESDSVMTSLNKASVWQKTQNWMFDNADELHNDSRSFEFRTEEDDRQAIAQLREKYDDRTGVQDTFLKVLEKLSDNMFGWYSSNPELKDRSTTTAKIMVHHNPNEGHLTQEYQNSTLTIVDDTDELKYTINIHSKTMLQQLNDQDDVQNFMDGNDFDYQKLIQWIQVTPYVEDIFLEKVILPNANGENVELPYDVLLDIANDMRFNLDEQTNKLTFGAEALLLSGLNVVAKSMPHKERLIQYVDFDFDVQQAYQNAFPEPMQSAKLGHNVVGNVRYSS